MEHVFIAGINSDIGQELAKRYLKDGARVSGTYRSRLSGVLSEEITFSGGKEYYCDFSDRRSIGETISSIEQINDPWDTFISAVGTMLPIGNFFQQDFNEWERSVYINSISQLKLLHGIYHLKCSDKINKVIFFAGGGTNNPFTNYSAYCVSKIFLIKMCELLDDENSDLNVFIIGPGMIKTKIHNETLKSNANSGENLKKTLHFLNSESHYDEDMDHIYQFIHWAEEQGRDVSGGRNFSIIHDPWQDSDESLLISELLKDNNKFKLRRYKNTGEFTK